jgi:hypothetical protein
MAILLVEQKASLILAAGRFGIHPEQGRRSLQRKMTGALADEVQPRPLPGVLADQRRYGLLRKDPL